jgi:predicted GNAT family acetyltransferase
VIVDDEQALAHNFRGWVPGEIAEGRAPVLAIVEDGHPASICFCARRSTHFAEAGLETAAPYRGRGLAQRVTTAWARACRAAGREPLYSTAWSNHASLAVARKLGLRQYASYWNALVTS